MPTEINLVNLTSTTISSSAYSVTGTSTDTFYVNCDQMSKLFIVATNSDTNAAAVTIYDCSSGTFEFSGQSIGDISTSIGASGAFRSFGPFEATRFKSTSGYLVISTTSSTESTNITWNAWRLP